MQKGVMMFDQAHLRKLILAAAVVVGGAVAMSASDADARHRCRRGGNYYRAPARVNVGYAPRYYGGYAPQRAYYGGPRYYGGGGWGNPGWGGYGGGGVAIGRGGIAIGW